MTSVGKSGRALIITGDSNEHLGLFDDLLGQPRIDVAVFPQNTTFLRKVATKVAPSVRFHWLLREHLRSNRYDRIIVVDSALSRMTTTAFGELDRSQAEVHLLLINSLGAASIALRLARPKIAWFAPRNVHTFDPVDSKSQGFHLIPPTYFSSKEIAASPAPSTDAYFVGGLKGGRTNMILDVFARLSDAGANVRFDCATDAGESIAVAPTQAGFVLNDGWIPYTEVLRHTLDTRCLVEILQSGQHAQTIRYFEAVAYDRLLLTNNPYVETLPFYDPEKIRIFSSPDDIDVDWIRNAPLPSFGYRGEFSPLNLPLLQEYIDVRDQRRKTS